MPAGIIFARRLVDGLVELRQEKVLPYLRPDSKTQVPLEYDGDTGLTGRKIIVDTYGGVGRHGGGCFSGKDPTKVDRSATYAARHVAKNIVAADLADRCEVQVSYAIGVPEPLSIYVDTFGTGKIPDKRLEEIVGQLFDLRPAAILDYYNLRRPIYKQTARYGHFGRTGDDYTWERTEKVEDLRNAAGL